MDDILQLGSKILLIGGTIIIQTTAMSTTAKKSLMGYVARIPLVSRWMRRWRNIFYKGDYATIWKCISNRMGYHFYQEDEKRKRGGKYNEIYGKSMTMHGFISK